MSTDEDCDQWTTSEPRALSDEELLMLQKQNQKLVSEFRSNKFEADAQKLWDLFYKRNCTNFFKDRHWTSREFEEIKRATDSTEKTVMLEAGCGVGNAIFPLMSEWNNLFVYACDFSPRAVQFVKDNAQYCETKCKAFQCDLTTQSLCDNILENSVDIVTLIFVLSAIHPDKFGAVLDNIYRVLKPGGYLLFRDYGLFDWAMLRFGPGSKISDQLYVRQDGTRAYYFSKEIMNKLAMEAKFEVVTNDYVMRETVNRKKDIRVPRVFLQGKFCKK